MNPSQASKYYFDYSDCASLCQQSFCLIYSNTPNLFETDCVDSAFECKSSASLTAVCMHPNMAPLGGEQLWLDFQKTRPQPTPAPQRQPNATLKITAIISLSGNGLLLLAVVVIILRRHRNPFEQLQEPMNPSPNASLESVSIS